MIIRKRRGREEIMPIRMTEVEVRLCRKLGLTVEQYVKEYLLMIAKQRRWKWFLERVKDAV